MRQRRLLHKVFAVQRRNDTEARDGLEAVADTDDQLARSNKFLQFVVQTELYAVGEHGTGAEMVAERKAADKGKDLEFLERALSGNKIVKMNHTHFGADIFKCRSGLFFAIQTESGNYQSFDFTHNVVPYMLKFKNIHIIV